MCKGCGVSDIISCTCKLLECFSLSFLNSTSTDRGSPLCQARKTVVNKRNTLTSCCVWTGEVSGTKDRAVRGSQWSEHHEKGRVQQGVFLQARAAEGGNSAKVNEIWMVNRCYVLLPEPTLITKSLISYVWKFVSWFTDLKVVIWTLQINMKVKSLAERLAGNKRLLQSYPHAYLCKHLYTLKVWPNQWTWAWH